MKILLVDDEATQRDMLQGFLERQGYKVISAASGEEALSCCARYPIDLVLLDQCMPGLSGVQVLEQLMQANPQLRVIMITAYGSIDTAVNVMKLGACDFIEKPVDLTALAEKIDQLEQEVAIDRDVAELNSQLVNEPLPFAVIAASEVMRELLSLLHQVAASPWTVLINGETGTGKELAARLIHQLSTRAKEPFIEVNCAAIPDNLFESELFGHERGAFTGATTRRSGRFAAAQKGTIFLDEIGELPLGLQAKLLRALQEKRICPVGANHEHEIDVRVVAATNGDLSAMVAAGTFREDLYYRLNVFEVALPPLRRRREDTPLLIQHFLGKYTQRPLTIEREAMDALIKYDYPGNVRELEHLVQRLATLVRGNSIRRRDLPSAILQPPKLALDSASLAARLQSVEQQMLLETLEQHGWVQTRAADALGISERVLRYKMAKHGLNNKPK
ncbi:MAG: sigma-54 dependent transcriptional regulator [Desulfuromonas sp.]|nr:sigma-54 dependent transcriptional regulator [Desulfuromonas sp.]